MISITNLCVSFGGHAILQNLSAQFEQGQVYGIMGLNGAGKTTLLNTLFGFIKPAAGDISYNGQKLNKKAVAYLETSNYFYSNITGAEYLRLFNQDKGGYTKWNKLFELPLHHLIESYSTGMKKKLALLGVLLQDKPVLLLDEPFNGLDIESIWVVQRVLAEIKQDKTILLTSHIVETLTANCDVIYRLQHRQMEQQYTQAEFTYFQEELYRELKDKTALR